VDDFRQLELTSGLGIQALEALDTLIFQIIHSSSFRYYTPAVGALLFRFHNQVRAAQENFGSRAPDANPVGRLQAVQETMAALLAAPRFLR
jgi:hypothetical protein